MTKDARYLAALQAEQLKRVAERSFPAFVRQAWPILEPTTPFLPNWHIALVCEYLEAVTAGEIRRLVINLPPRYGKSLLVSVLWPAWEWIRHPATRWVFTSYADSLAGQHSQDRRTLLQSPWYCGHWGHRVSLTHPTEASEYWNTQRGRMLATSVGAAVTGKGGNRIVVDDPHTPLGAESDAQRHRVIEYFRRSVATRLDDKQRGAIVVVMQRLHAQDLTATCLDLGYTPLCLPAEATSRTTIRFPRSGRVVTRAPGDLLWPAREGPEEMAQRRVELGAYGFAGQYQQSPSPRTGGLFERRWWAFYDDLPTGVDAWHPVLGFIGERRARARLCRGPRGRQAGRGHLSGRPGQGPAVISRHAGGDPADVSAVSIRADDSGRRHRERPRGDRHAPTRNSRHHRRPAAGRQGPARDRLRAARRSGERLPAPADRPDRAPPPGAGVGRRFHRAAGGVSHGGARRRRGCVHPAAPALAPAADVARDGEAPPAGGEWAPAAAPPFLAGRPHPRGEG